MSASPAIDLTDRPARILLVDDEPDNLEVLDLILAWEGFVISQAGSGSEALAMVAKQSPDLILLDVMMPGMSGYEVLAKLKADPATSATPVMMVSAILDPGAKGRALTAGSDDFLSKPIDREDLVWRVRNLLGKTFAGCREDKKESHDSTPD
jgi:CheY-like chemotaxis protein